VRALAQSCGDSTAHL